MKAFIPYIFVLLALLVHLTHSQGDKCSEPCIVGQTDYFKPPAYGAYGLGYVHSPEQPPLLNVQSSAITTGVIIIHGNSGDVNNYYCWMKWALQSIGKDETSYIVAPHFVILEDGPAPEAMYWNTGTWKQGGLSALRPRIASFQVLDDMLVVFANKTLFPSLKDILVVGHSAGGQTVQRYAIATPIDPVIKALNVTLRYIAENSGTFAYLDTARPILPNITLPTCTACNATAIPQRDYSFAPVSNETKASCPAYNDWRMGLDNGLAYLTARSLADVRAEYRYKDVTYVHGSNDTCNTGLGDCGCNDNTLDKGCDGMLQGFCRFDRGWIFYRYLKYYYGEQVHNIAVVANVGHDGCRMLNSDVTLNIMFPPTTDCGVEFSQTKINSWTSYGEPWSQWQATMRVGAKPLYSVEILTSHTAESFYPWNINLVPGTTNIYTLPRYHYNYGVIPAGSSYVTFGYVLSSPNASTITLNNRACIPKPCPVGLTPWFQSSRVAGSYTYKNYVLQANNTSPSTSNALITLQFNFYGGAFVQSSSYLNPSTSSAGTTTQNFICSRSPQSTCTYTISVLTSNLLPVNHEVSTVQSICL